LQRDEMAVLRIADGKIAEARKFHDAAGMSGADLFETKDGVMPFPGWGPFEAG
jgi:hypothetical protein